VAGPLAGLVFAIPALFFGLQYSKVIIGDAPVGLSRSGVEIGSSFLMALLSKLALGSAAAEGHWLILHPLAFASWLGLLVSGAEKICGRRNSILGHAFPARCPGCADSSRLTA
jgi:hypothetical protein